MFNSVTKKQPVSLALLYNFNQHLHATVQPFISFEVFFSFFRFLFSLTHLNADEIFYQKSEQYALIFFLQFLVSSNFPDGRYIKGKLLTVSLLGRLARVGIA